MAWLGGALTIFGSLLFMVALMPSFGGQSARARAFATRHSPADGGRRHAARGSGRRSSRTSRSGSSESTGARALALPAESPRDVVDLAEHFPGTWLVIIHGDDHGGWPAVLATDAPGAECFDEVDLGSPADPRLARALDETRVSSAGLPMSDDPYTRERMDAARTNPEPRDDAASDPGDSVDARDEREAGEATIDTLHAEAGAAISYTANTLRSVRERYRAAYNDELARWQALSDELDTLERRPPNARPRLVASQDSEPSSPEAEAARAAEAAETQAEDDRVRILRSAVTNLGHELGSHQTELAKLEVALRNFESTWLFLKRGDASLIGGGEKPPDRDPDADRRGPGVGALPARPGDPRRAGPGAVERDLPGRVHRAGHRSRRPAGPDGAAIPPRAAPPRARLASGRSSASSGRPSSTSSASRARSRDAVARTTALTGLAIADRPDRAGGRA